jgi:hypothetical protein
VVTTFVLTNAWSVKHHTLCCFFPRLFVFVTFAENNTFRFELEKNVSDHGETLYQTYHQKKNDED